MNNTIIDIKDVSMHFNLMIERVDSIKEYIFKFFKGNLLFNDFQALKNISFSIREGEIVGLIGLNGAGKSTLLKIISGVLKPTTGNVYINGTIAPLIEVGAGFDPDLTARENIYLNGAILGYTKELLDEKFNEILEFAELQDFIDVPLKNFSSGMYARLGFSIATVIQPDILIVDETLSVGDYKFQEKCEKRIQNMIDNGVTIIIVSHSIEMIKRLCTKVVWLEEGNIRAIGKTKDICSIYEIL